MKKILIIGNSPLPYEDVNNRPAAGLRTYQFIKPLIESGYDILLVAIAMPECYGEKSFAKEESHKNFKCIRISKDDVNLSGMMQQIHDEFRPDVILGVNTFPSYIASRINSSAPFWADLNGWIMAEAQAQAFKMKSNDYLPHYFEMERSILECADKFSTVSYAQKNAVLGELGVLGRLNNETFGYDFISHIPNGTEWLDNEKNLTSKRPETIPQNSFILLWMGGYNTWVDENTLFNGVSAAMVQCPHLYFISTGGEIKGLDDETFGSFKKKIDESKFKDRFIFLGWVKSEEIPGIYKASNAGLNIDRDCVETHTGARNRLNEMMKFGLPVITTFGSEISYEAVQVGAGVGVKNGDTKGLTEAVMEMYKLWEDGSVKLELFGRNGQKYISEECNYMRTIVPFLEWVKNPGEAPDRGVKIDLNKKISFSAGLKYLQKNGLQKTSKKLFTKLKNII